jgi:hypothetical protein
MDVFVGVSKAGALTKEMAESMNKDSIVFALANPIPEIMPEVAKEAGVAVIATGRSDFPNQLNNSLIFPGLFKGVLDANIKQFDITKRSLIRIGMYQRGHKTEASRLWHHNTHYENFTTTGQTGNENSYAIDFAKDEYIHKGYTHPSNVIWVTYRC